MKIYLRLRSSFKIASESVYIKTNVVDSVVRED
jgi:hypothetical protein